jgi:hypothetical protein
MAYVAISTSLMNEVESKINRMKEADANLIQKPIDEVTYQTLPNDLEQLLWGSHYHLKDVIPDDWKVYNKEFRANTRFLHDGTELKSMVAIKTAMNTAAPPKTSTYTAHFDIPADHPIIAEVVQRDIAYYENNKKWKAIRSQIRDFLNNCKSLNEAVKLWPDVRIYIPNSYMERMLAKSERTAEKISKASEFLKQIDTDNAVAAAVGARMAGAKV